MAKIIGDVHGKTNQYMNIIKTCKESIQLGDFGFKKQHHWHKANVDSDKHKVLFGNHDDQRFVEQPHSLGHFGVYRFPISGIEVFYIRGAYSIDKYMRTEGVDWRPGEELNQSEGRKCVKLFGRIKPDIVISHDCPSSMMDQYISHHFEESITNQMLQACFELHKPKHWIHGHHHISQVTDYEGTKFHCLEELESLDLRKIDNES